MMKGKDEEADDDVGTTGFGDTHGTLSLLMLLLVFLILLLLVLRESSGSLESLGGFTENS